VIRDARCAAAGAEQRLRRRHGSDDADVALVDQVADPRHLYALEACAELGFGHHHLPKVAARWDSNLAARDQPAA